MVVGGGPSIRISLLEGAIITWTKQIRNVLKQDSESQLKQVGTSQGGREGEQARGQREGGARQAGRLSMPCVLLALRYNEAGLKSSVLRRCAGCC